MSRSDPFDKLRAGRSTTNRLKKSLIALISIGVLLLVARPTTSSAVCIKPPGYDPAGDPEINLDLLSWGKIDGLLDQFVFVHPTDPKAPQLSTLIEGICDLTVTSVNMISGTGRPPAPDIPADYANLVCFSTPVGASVLVPDSGYDIGGGCEAVVLYATSHSIVLKYTPDDNIVSGYTVYLHSFQVDPGLLAFYNEYAWNGSGELPNVSGGERIGVSSGEICVAIRDTGTYMDPRWQEWWNQCPASARDLILKLTDVCLGELPAPGECWEEFPEDIACCPITSPAAPGWFAKLYNAAFDVTGDFLDWLINMAGGSMAFTLYTEGNLQRAESLPADASYFWAVDESQPDPRTLLFPEQKPEENGMWPGVAMRLAPPCPSPNCRPQAIWRYHREERRNMWQIPFPKKYEIDPWWGDDGEDGDKSKMAHHPLMMGAEDAWGWLINTPGLEERIAARLSPSAPVGTSPPSSGGMSSTLGINNAPPPTSSPQTLGTQLAATTSAGGEICNPPYPTSYHGVCSDVGERPVTTPDALRMIVDHYVHGGLKINPRFTYLERISYRLAGILTDNPLFKALKEEGTGGALNLFLPPDWSAEDFPAPNNFPAYDAPADLGMFLQVDITWNCVPPLVRVCEYTYRCCSQDAEGNWGCRDVGGCHECNPGEECRVTESCKCCLPTPIPGKYFWCRHLGLHKTLELKTEHDHLLIRYLGSQTNALNVTQQWLAPPQ